MDVELFRLAADWRVGHIGVRNARREQVMYQSSYRGMGDGPNPLLGFVVPPEDISDVQVPYDTSAANAAIAAGYGDSSATVDPSTGLALRSTSPKTSSSLNLTPAIVITGVVAAIALFAVFGGRR